MTFGQLLRSERERAGKTLRQLAAHLDLSATYLSNVERDRNHPFADSVIKRTAAFLGVDERALLAAAIETRGVAKLDAVNVSELHRTVGAKLARAWPTLNSNQLEAIRAVIEGTP